MMTSFFDKYRLIDIKGPIIEVLLSEAFGLKKKGGEIASLNFEFFCEVFATRFEVTAVLILSDTLIFMTKKGSFFAIS